KDLIDTAIDFDRLENLTALHVHQPGGYAKHLTDALVAARDDPLGSNETPELGRHFLVELGLDICLELPENVEYLFATDDYYGFLKLEVGGDGLGDSRADPLIL